jgi:hypothetical protein
VPDENKLLKLDEIGDERRQVNVMKTDLEENLRVVYTLESRTSRVFDELAAVLRGSEVLRVILPYSRMTQDGFHETLSRLRERVRDLDDRALELRELERSIEEEKE